MEKSCKSYAIDLSAYFDGELNRAEASGLEAHLSTCKTCQASLDKMRRISMAMGHLSQPRVGQNAGLDNLMSSLDRELGQSSPKSPQVAKA